MRRMGKETAGECPVETTLRYIGGAWKVLIIWHLRDGGRHRYAEIKRQLSGITPKILAEQLREMERDGLVHRRVYPEVPPRVEYQLTARGKTLEPVIDAMCAWGTEQLRTGFANLVESASR
jgi:DNA-binding HxlR family transcriptional regulator